MFTYINKVRVQIVSLTGAIRPRRFYPRDAGYDLYVFEDVVIPPNSVICIRSGISLVMPRGVVAEIRGRSSTPSKGLIILTGTIDGGYLGEVLIQAYNYTSDCITAKTGDRIAQLVFAHQISLVDEPTFHESDTRDEAGFGSTDNKYTTTP